MKYLNPKLKAQSLNVKNSLALGFGIFFSIWILAFGFFKPAFAIYEGTPPPPQPSYVENEVIVKYKLDQSPTDIQRAVSKRESRAASFFGQVQNTWQNFSLRLQGEETPEDKLNRLSSLNQRAGVVSLETLFENKVLGPGTPPELQGFVLYKTNGQQSVEEMAAGYQALSEVEFAEPNYLYEVMKTPNDPKFNQLWGLVKIKTSDAWEETVGSEEIMAAVIDTGVDSNHEDLAGQVINGGACNDSNGDSSPQGSHGTHVAGTIGAIGNNGIGVVGVNWRVKLLAYRIVCDDKLSAFAGAWAIRDAADRGAKVANMSWGTYFYSQTLKSAVDYAYGKGMVLVGAAGNVDYAYGKRACSVSYPAKYESVIAVGATSQSDTRASFSCQGPEVEVAAPGVNVLSTYPNNQYGIASGTSMATPHVAGLVALMYAKDPSLTPQKVREILQTTAVDLGSSGRDSQFGFGRIDAAAALAAVSGGTNPTATPGVTETPTPTGGTTLTPTSQPTNTLTPTVTPPGPTVTPSPTQTVPTATSTPPVGSHPCQDKALQGDYNCDSQVNKADFTVWLNDYKEGKTTLSFFEYWRRRMNFAVLR